MAMSASQARLPLYIGVDHLLLASDGNFWRFCDISTATGTRWRLAAGFQLLSRGEFSHAFPVVWLIRNPFRLLRREVEPAQRLVIAAAKEG